MVAHVLQLMGLEFGRDLLPACAHPHVSQIHDTLLRDLGRSWRDLRPLPEHWIDSEPALQARHALGAVIADETEQTRLWGVKDPRLCRLLPLWERAVEDVGAVPGVVIVLRSPHEAASTLAVRDGVSRPSAVALYVDHLLQALADSEEIPRTLLSQESLLRGWRKTLEHAEADLDIRWPHRASPPEAEIEKAIQGMSPVPENGEDLGLEDAAALVWATRLFRVLMESTGDDDEMSSADEVHDGDDSIEEIRDQWRIADGLYRPELARLALEGRTDRDRRNIAEGKLEASEHARLELQRALENQNGNGEVTRELAAALDRAAELQSTLLESHARQTELEEMLDRGRLQRERLEQREQRTRREMAKVQGHLTGVLSGRLYRYTRTLRRVWHRLRRSA